MDSEVSSRIFVRGLPPTMNDADFKKHFGKYSITDTRLFPQRRIGYVGYETPEDAAKAVKYFNRTFIRMSKIAVELARPIGEAPTRQQYQTPYQTPYGVQPQSAVPTVPTPVESAASLKRKRGSPEPVTKDPKLQEFLQNMKRPSQLRGHAGADPEVMDAVNAEMPQVKADIPEGESDSEYENVPKKTKSAIAEKPVLQQQTPPSTAPEAMDVDELVAAGAKAAEPTPQDGDDPETTASPPNALSDDEWLRSRTSRLLGLAEDDDEDAQAAPAPTTSLPPVRQDKADSDFEGFADEDEQVKAEAAIPVAAQDEEPADSPPANELEEKIRQSQRLYIRNLSYQVKEDDLREAFNGFGNLDEVHVPMDPKTNAGKGFAYLQFTDAESAVAAARGLDGRVFQGRLLHILPAAVKRTTELDDFALSKLPLKKQQQIKKRRDAATSTFNWNALYMNADAVMSSVADRLGVSKAELLDPTSADAGVKQAHAETHVIQETKKYFKEHGVDLEAFKKNQRGDTAILVKNFPYDAKAAELKELFEEHGKLKRFLMPPAGTIAIVEFEQPPQARAAFASLAYRKMRSSVLFLEKAPSNIFTSTAPETIDSTNAASQSGIDAKVSSGDLLEKESTQQDAPGTTATLFVRNLNFTTTSDRLTDIFKPLGGFLTARVKTKTDPKKPGQVLSMGFGFLEFRDKQQAQAAQQAMDGYSLDGHKLQIRASHRATDAAEERRNEDKAKKQAARGTKIIVKNLPFEATKKDIRTLFGAYGQLRSVRVPKKFNQGARGFAFADFTTPKEAENAMDALRDTHLLGRRLVLDFAAEESEDAEVEIEKMQQKAGSQLNKVALQKLTGAGRKKFRVGDDQEPLEA